MDYRSQIDLPIPANHDKSPIRKQEFDQHLQGDLHIQNDGQLNQMLVMTSLGPRMMFPKLNCQCDMSYYGCDCRIVFDDDPPLSGNPRDVIQVACGIYSTYFLLRNGEVWSCGANNDGQLGRAVINGHYQNGNLDQMTNLPSSVIQIAATDTSFFALLNNGDVWCAGDNTVGQLGYAQASGSATATNLAKHPNLSGVKSIFCGKDFTYFLLHDGTVRNCGNNEFWQLGRFVSPGTAMMPNLGLFPLSGAKKLVCGDATTYIQIGDHEVWTCGNNAQCQCGFTDENQLIIPPRPAYTAPIPIRDISCGTKHGLVVLNDGGLVATGQAGVHAYPQTGSQAFTEISSVSGIDRAVASNDYSLFLRSGSPWICGHNLQGQLLPGTNTSPVLYRPFVTLEGLPFHDMSTGERSSFWIQSDGRVFALGDNFYGQLGFLTAQIINNFGTVDFH